MVIAALSDYPYLCWSMVLSLIFIVIFIRAKRFRLLMVLSGFASALYSLTAVFFVPEYWQPVLLIKTLVGLEDVLFSFANGGIVAFMSFWIVRNRMQVCYSLDRLLTKFFFCTLFGVIICSLFRKAGAPFMTCCLYAMLVVGLALLVKNWRHWPLSLMGALGFTSLYTVIAGMLSIGFPLFHTQWTMKNLWGYRFLSFPVEEYLWAFGFGAVFPLIMAFALGITLVVKNDGQNKVFAAITDR